MAASSSFKENVEERKTVRRSRSSSIENSHHDPLSLSPSTGRTPRHKISRSMSISSKSPSERRRRTISRSNSGSKKERLKDKVAKSRSKSKDESSDRLDPKGKSYLSQKASEKKGSKGRKASVLGSLDTFLDDESSKPSASSRKRDAQSVVSSTSRRRRRSHTPSSASLVGGMSISREELRRQRRSSSEGPLDRKVREGKRSNSHRSRNPSKEPQSKESSSRRRDPSKEHVHRSRDLSRPLSSSNRKESSRSRTRSASVSLRGDRAVNTTSKSPSKSVSTGAKRRPSVEIAKSGLSSKPSRSEGGFTTIEQTEKIHMSLSNGADIPPGFPAAAVDSNNQTMDGDVEVTDAGDNNNAPVLESTARLRERQAIMSESTTVMTNNSPGALTKVGDKTRRSRRRSILGSIQAAEKSAIQAHLLQDPQDRRKSLRATMSESAKSPSIKFATQPYTDDRSELLLPQTRKESVTGSVETNAAVISKKEIDGMPSSNVDESPGRVVKKTPKSSEETPKGERKGLWWNLSKVDKKKSSSKASTQKGSSQSVISAPALAGKISSVFVKARGKKSKSSSENELKTDSFDRLEASNASLDLNLLTESPSIQNVANVDELFDDERKGASLRDQDDDIISNSSSDDDKYLNQTGANTNGGRRLSWVELPLFNPEQLLMKSTDQDGANELTELSSHLRRIDEWKEESLKSLTERLEKKNTNPSLQATIGKDNERRENGVALDEKTVITTTTNSSDATTKTSNFVASAKKSAHLSSKNKALGTSQDSLAIDQLDAPPLEDGGSLGSLSQSSRRSKESKSSKGSKSSKESKESKGSAIDSAERTKTRHSSNSHKRKEVFSSPRIHERNSASHGTGKDVHRRSGAKQRSGEKLIEDKPGEGVMPLMKKPSLERKTSIRSRLAGETTPKKSYLNKRKHSRTDKAESHQAKRAVNSSLDAFLEKIENAPPVMKDENRSVHSSMQDKERRRRSRDRERNRNGERIHSRRINRFDPKKHSLESALNHLRGGGDESEDTDGMSVTSAPLLRYKTSASSLLKKQDSQRPVVDLKKTQFSSKLTKLHVAF